MPDTAGTPGGMLFALKYSESFIFTDPPFVHLPTCYLELPDEHRPCSGTGAEVRVSESPSRLQVVNKCPFHALCRGTSFAFLCPVLGNADE